ncbi:hypothetical protein, partial [uncultured Helicobacter sp.]|uniref:hypothetical protein n=1 Tax=uncultured Helicobacter sp. TaxID=175537 RepID=UPI0037513879
ESKQPTQSTTPKNPSEALPNINNVRNSASRAESMPIDSAIFAEQKSNQCVGAIAPTATRPCRVWQSVSFFRKIRSKVAAVPPLIFLKKLRFLKKLALCLDKEIARHSQQKSGALSFSGLGRAGRGETLFSFAQTSDDENLGSIRESVNLRG